VVIVIKKEYSVDGGLMVLTIITLQGIKHLWNEPEKKPINKVEQ
jgi:hypothetical protein